jgi:hypothetical protein
MLIIGKVSKQNTYLGLMIVNLISNWYLGAKSLFGSDEVNPVFLSFKTVLYL